MKKGSATHKGATLFDAGKLPAGRVRIKQSASTTMVTMSSGLATFHNVSDGPVSVAVWFDNGVHGHSNAVIEGDGDWSIQVQTGDTYSSVFGSDGVPDGTPRYAINYGINNVG